MNNASSFNLLKFVERPPVLSFNKIVIISILYVVIFMTYFLIQQYQFRDDTKKIAQLQIGINESMQKLQPVLNQGVENPVTGIFFTGALKNNVGFYPEFEALSHIYVQGLWLTEVMIQRNPSVIKITGAMDSPDKLNQLLQQLSAQSAFQGVHFMGVDIKKGMLPNVPEQYQDVIAQLKLPQFYHFVIQTTALNQTEVR